MPQGEEASLTAKRLEVIITGDARSLYRALNQGQTATSRFGNVLKSAATIGVGALAVGLAESVKQAVGFQSEMEKLVTQANVSQKQLGYLKKGVLGLAGPTATAPDELAKGLYHLASQGLRGQKALGALKISAEGAKVGGANLEDVTNALGATIVSNIKGSKNYTQAMGQLNATVGAGDMRMQDLADAMGTGLPSSAKIFGVSLKDISAALAVFGDNNIRGAKAGTLLNSALRLMAAPSKAGAKALGAIGIGATTLGDKMRGPGGLSSAFELLRTKLKASGLTATQQGVLLTRAFGGRQSVGIKLLLGQLDRFHRKEREVGAGATGFGKAWRHTTETAAYKFDRLKASLDAIAIKVGNKLMPYLVKGMDWLNKHFPQIASTVGKIAGDIGKVASAIDNVVQKTTGWKTLIEAIAIAIAGMKVGRLVSAFGMMAPGGRRGGFGGGGGMGRPGWGSALGNVATSVGGSLAFAGGAWAGSKAQPTLKKWATDIHDAIVGTHHYMTAQESLRRSTAITASVQQRANTALLHQTPAEVKATIAASKHRDAEQQSASAAGRGSQMWRKNSNALQAMSQTAGTATGKTHALSGALNALPSHKSIAVGIQVAGLAELRQAVGLIRAASSKTVNMVFNTTRNLFTHTQKKQAGGRVGRGLPYLVGEMGPEMFVPGTNGTIVSNRHMRSGRGGGDIHVYIDGVKQNIRRTQLRNERRGLVYGAG